MKKKFLLGVILCTALLLSACSGGETKIETTTAVASAEETTTEPEMTTEEETTTEAAPEETKLAINEEGVLKDWGIVVTNSQILDKISENEYYAFTPGEGNKFLFISVSISNNGKESDTFLPSFGMGDDVYAKVYYGDGYEFSSTNLLGYGNNLLDTHVNPLSTKTGDLAFEIPDAVADSEDELLLRFYSGNDELTYKLR